AEVCSSDLDLPPTADWASGGLSISIPCPRPLPCTAPAGGAGSGEKHIDVDLATGGPARLCPVGGLSPIKARTRAGSRYPACSQTGPPAPSKNAPRSVLSPEGVNTNLLPEGRPSITGPPRSSGGLEYELL